MSVFDFMLNNISVTQTNKHIIFSGFRVKYFIKEIERNMETTRFTKGMLTHITGMSFRVPLFFCYDFMNVLESSYINRTRYYDSKVTARVILEFKKIPLIQRTLKDFPTRLNKKALDQFLFKPLPSQSEFFDIYDKKTQQYGLNGYILGAAPGTGKAQPLSSLIKTPTGWVRMGEMHIGQEIITADGSVTKVTGVYPQGVLPKYRITFGDERTVECSGDHLWKAQIRTNGRQKDWAVVTTEEILRVKKLNDSRVHVPLYEPEEGEIKDLPIDPYVLGLLLGNGGMSQDVIRYSTMDKCRVEVINNYFQQFGIELIRKSEYDYTFRKDKNHALKDVEGIRLRLKKLDLQGKMSYQKHIPPEYLAASRSQRLALVQGLLDTDGTVNNGGAIQYCTTSPSLADNFQYLIHSLGGMAKISEKIPHYTYRGNYLEGRKAYIIHVRFKNPRDLFQLPRKKDRLPEQNQYSKNLRLRVVKVELIGQEHMQCISVEHPSRLYITNGYVVTHNTLMSLMLAFQLPEITKIVVISPTNALNEVWADTVENKIKNEVPYYVYGKGQPERGKRVYIFSHDNLKFAKEIILGMLQGERIFFIVDECHSFNEMKSDRTNYLIEICQKSNTKDVLFMSGTPFKAFGREIIPFLYSADPLFNEDAVEGFGKIFGARGNLALEILSARIGRTVHLIEKKEVVQNQVTNFELRVKVPNGERFTMAAIRIQMEKFVKERVSYYHLHAKRLEGEYLRIRSSFGKYLVGQALKDFEVYCDTVEQIRHAKDLSAIIPEIRYVNNYERRTIIPNLNPSDKKIFRDTTSVYKYVALKIQGEALGRILGRERTLCNLEILKNLDNSKVWCEELKLEGESFQLDDIFAMSESKVVFFTDYVEVLQEAETFLKKRGYRPKVVYGETNKDLSDILHKFETDPKVNPIVATLKSLSTAVPLIMADTEVLLNVPYRDYIYKQTVARVDRIGQKHPIKIFHVYLDTDGEPNISTRSKDLMEWSRQMVDKLLGIDTQGAEEQVEEEFTSSFAEGFVTKFKNLLGFK